MTKTTTSPKTCQHTDTREEKSGYGHTSTVTVCNDCGSDLLTCEGCGHTGRDVTEESQDGSTVVTICASCADDA